VEQVERVPVPVPVRRVEQVPIPTPVVQFAAPAISTFAAPAFSRPMAASAPASKPGLLSKLAGLLK
jgi:hypothetical protein